MFCQDLLCVIIYGVKQQVFEYFDIIDSFDITEKSQQFKISIIQIG